MSSESTAHPQAGSPAHGTQGGLGVLSRPEDAALRLHAEPTGALMASQISDPAERIALQSGTLVLLGAGGAWRCKESGRDPARRRQVL